MAQGIIYRVVNLKNNKVYIGQTIQKLEERKSKHYSVANNPNIKGYYFQRALNKYIEQDWEWSILEKCDSNLLNEREIYWIKYYNSYKKGYNSTEGGAGISGTGKIYTIYHPEKGILKGDYKYLSKKIKADLYAINSLSCGKSKSVKGWVLYQYKNRYHLQTKRSSNAKIIKIYHINYGVLEGTINHLHKIIGCSYSNLAYLENKKVKFAKNWVMYDDKDNYKDIVNYKEFCYEGKCYQGFVQDLVKEMNISLSKLYKILRQQ